jgi:hypothetical protein
MERKTTGKKQSTRPKPRAKAAPVTKEKPEAKKSSKAVLSKVPVEYVFWCNNGSTFSDLEELAAGLRAMSDETYTYHCNLDKQDFANWVRDVVEDEILAADLARAVNRIEAAECAAARIAILAGDV